MGTFTQKIDRQPMDWTSRPPRIGPEAALTPNVAPQMPIATARSLASVKVLERIESEFGLSIEPPIACSMRKTISEPRLGARLHNSDPVEKITRPIWNMRRRPIRSPVEPERINRLAITRM